MSRIFNFSAGPSTLPLEVLEEARAEFVDYQGSGMSIMEGSHRAKEYAAVHTEAMDNLKQLLKIPDSHDVLLLQGGATTQFAMVPLNLLGPGQTADYTHSGAWAKKAIAEARIIGNVNIAADTSKAAPSRMPEISELKVRGDAAYLHITSNETIGGTQWKTFPKGGAPLVADMSSDILARPIPVADFGIIYAGAQKNMGPSGVAAVIIRKDLCDRVPETVPMMFRYKTHLAEDSLYNTPPTFSIYMLCLVTRWLLGKGGVEAMQQINERKAAKIYDLIDSGDYYRGTADPAYRSPMNVTLRLPSEELELAFLKQAEAEGFSGLKGHRSVGGVRASIYNAFPESGVDALVEFMKDFAQKNG